MAHVHYEEEQRFSQVAWIWVALVLLLILAPIVTLLDTSASEKDITTVLLTTVFAFIPMAGVLLFAKLQIKIDGTGLHYRFFPSVFKWRIISKNNISSLEISERKNLLEKLEWGYRNNKLAKTISMNITGIKYARLSLKDGRKFKIGTINPESMERALRKLTSPDND